MRRILVFAPINLNVIDGSSVWLRTAVKMLAAMPETKVHLLTAFCPLGEIPDVDGASRIVHPSDYLLTHSGMERLAEGMRITAENVSEAVEVLDRLYGYHYLVVRGADEAIALSRDSGLATIPYLTDVGPEVLLEPPGTGKRAQLAELLEAAPLIFCQTPELQTMFEELAPDAGPRIVPLPPMLPDQLFETAPDPAPPEGGTTRLVYAGKFSTGWGAPELMKLARGLTDEGAPCEIHVFGDKIHGESETFVAEVRTWLDSGPITYHGGVPRAELLGWLRRADVGFAYRAHALTASPEISTKLLEYIATGTLPLVNRSRLHETYLGEDYPFFANSYDELLEAARHAIRASPDERLAALGHGRSALAKHRISTIAEGLAAAFRRLEPIALPLPDGGRRRALLITGHELKFMGHLKSKLFHSRNFDVTTERRPGFRFAESNLSCPLTDYDLILCEWAAGNAVFYSHARVDGQRLFVRFHRFEITTSLPQQIDVAQVERVVFVSEHQRRDALAQYGWPKARTCVIPNSVDVQAFERDKTADAAFNLGILGVLPRLKRFDLALDLLERLRKEDRRYQLHVKGKMPWDLPWVYVAPAQRAYFERQLGRIRSSSLLQGAVCFDRFGLDTPRWFEKIGWILSVSDIESFHLAAMEGMASGAAPLVIARSGASEVFPPRYIYPDVEAMAETVLTSGGRTPDEIEVRAIKAWAGRFDLEPVTRMWAELIG